MSLDTVRQLIAEAGYATMATSIDGQPRVRPMAFVMLDDGRLWSSTYCSSGKYEELKENPRVELCFVGKKRVHLRISGIADVTGDEKKKAELLRCNPKVGKHFSGGDDPNFVHIEVVPTDIRYKEHGFCEYTVVELSSSPQ